MGDSVPYLVVGFGLTWGVVLVYAWRLESRLGSARERLERHGESGSRVRPADGGTPGDATTAESEERPEDMR